MIFVTHPQHELIPILCQLVGTGILAPQALHPRRHGLPEERMVGWGQGAVSGVLEWPT